MADEHERIADIIAQKRDEAAAIRADLSCVPVRRDGQLAEADAVDAEADRLEAAHRRELAASGNAAKLREALVRCRNCAQMIPQLVQASKPERSSLNAAADYANLILRDVADALSAPPRNCDRPECATTKAAQDVWRKEDGGKTAYYEWLLAPATKQEGGAE